MIYHFDDLAFRPISAERFAHKNGVFEVKARQFAALSFRTRGTATFDVANQHLISTPGSVLFIPANTPYRVDYSNSESIVIHLEHCNYTEPECIHLCNATPIEARFASLPQTWSETRSVNRVRATLYDILDKIAQDQTPELEDTALIRCVAYINAHFCESTLSVDAVCRHGFISPSTLQRKFYGHFGTSPKQYLLKLRMSRALDLLLLNEHSVKDVAYATGFTDEKYFSRAFRKTYGYPPSQLQKRHLG